MKIWDKILRGLGINKKDLKCIQDLDIKKIIQLDSKSMLDFRAKLRVLIIDDEELAVIEGLRNSGYRITHKKDIDDFIEIEPYEVILCDIRGVGKKFGSEKEGAHLIEEIHKLYSNKYLIAYTGSTHDTRFSKSMKIADDILTKAKTIDEWINALDNAVGRFMDPQFQWKKLRHKLLDNNIPIGKVAELEDVLVRSIENNEFYSFNKLVDEIKEREACDAIHEFLESQPIKLLAKGVLACVS